MLKALNDQINAEMHSSYLYLGMSAWFKSKNLDGMAAWMSGHSREEWSHAMKIFGYIYGHRCRVTLQDIKKPATDWNSPLDAFNAGFAAEEATTKAYVELIALAQKENDTATFTFLQWFVTEQVEEEALFDSVIEKVKLAGDHPPALMFLDRALGESAEHH
jgi:ferritin